MYKIYRYNEVCKILYSNWFQWYNTCFIDLYKYMYAILRLTWTEVAVGELLYSGPGPPPPISWWFMEKYEEPVGATEFAELLVEVLLA